jgi:hypothetical protein
MLDLAADGRTEPIFSRTPRSRAAQGAAAIAIKEGPAISSCALRKKDSTKGRKGHKENIKKES